MTTDAFNAFMPESGPQLTGADGGELSGLTFVVKDVFDVAGVPTSNGQPVWRATHPIPDSHSASVRLLLAAGASLVGKTVCDEMCYSLAGENAHYGAPVNPAAPEHSVGGSSSGSAAAVAGNQVDFALGTDCGGSVRCPASFSGILGIRPSYGRVDDTGVVPLAHSFDVVGWLARDPDVFERVARILLDNEANPITPKKAIIALDAFGRLPEDQRQATETAAYDLIDSAGLETESLILSDEGLDHWFDAFRHLQALEIWETHRDWVTSHKPAFGPGVRERFEFAATLTQSDRSRWQPVREAARNRLSNLLQDGSSVVIMPTAPCSPRRNASASEVDAFRARTMGLTCPAGLSGMPQISLPLARRETPLGISILGPAGSDEALIGLACKHLASS